MSTSQEAIYQEALGAIQAGERARARDLLTRLLKTQPNQSDYWLWMSAVVDTPKERAYCLKQALQEDPQNTAAARGLVLMGLLPPDPAEVIPTRLQKRDWRSEIAGRDGLDAAAKTPRKTQIVLIVAAFVVLVGLAGFAIWGTQQQSRRTFHMPVIDFPTDQARPGGTVTATVASRPTLPPGTPDPLWMQLKATYTPTPLYVNTPHPVAEAYSIGMRAYQRGDWANAVTYLAQAASITANSPDVLFYLGEAYRGQGNNTAAINTFNQAIAQAPDFAPGYYGRALAVLASTPEKTDAILKDLQTAVQKDPDFSGAYLGMAQMYLHVNQPAEALSALDQAARMTPDSALISLYRAKAYLAQGNTQKALSFAQQARAKDVTLLEAYRIEGLALQAEKNDQAAIQPLSVYVLYQPEDAGAWTALAQAYLASHQPDEARRALNKALQLDHNRLEAYLLRGQLLLDQKDPAGAMDDFNAALRLDSRSFAANLGLGEALLAQNQAGDAYMQFEKTQALAKEDPQKAELQFWTAQSLDRLGEIKAALREYQALVALPGSSVKPEWITTARARIAALATPTPTLKPQTATPTRTPTRTPRPTQTRWPTATSRP